jgi:uncharacterized protein YoxC
MSKAAEEAGISIDSIEGEDAVETMKRLSDAMTGFKTEAINGLTEKINSVNQELEETPYVINNATEAIKENAESWREYNEE